VVKFRTLLGRIAAYVGHLSQISIDADKDWGGKKIINPIIVNDVVAAAPARVIDLNIYTRALATWDKHSEITLLKIKGTLRIDFELQLDGGAGTANAKIYRNGAAIGTERGVTAGAAYTKFTEDIAGWDVTDTCELWIKGTGDGNDTHAKNFVICYK